jgi:hypothetical protein
MVTVVIERPDGSGDTFRIKQPAPYKPPAVRRNADISALLKMLDSPDPRQREHASDWIRSSRLPQDQRLAPARPE